MALCKLVDECDCCNFGPVMATQYDNVRTKIGGGGAIIEVTRWYCCLCAGTLASTHGEYLDSDATVLKTICFIGNMILTRLEEREKMPSYAKED